MRYLPTKHELKIELIRQADILHDGVFAPGIGKFDLLRPGQWLGARAILRRFGRNDDTGGWRTLVHELTALSLVTHSESQQLRRAAVKYAESLAILQRERMARRRQPAPYDPDEFPTGVRVSSRRVIGRRVYLLLR